MQADRDRRRRMSPAPEPSEAFASPADHAECRRLHKKFGTTYYFATQTFPKSVRHRVHALYGFVRVPDEWVDSDLQTTSPSVIAAQLDDYRSQLIRAADGVCPREPVLRAFADVIRETGMALDEPLEFLSAMTMDLSTHRYETYEDLETYMRGSAAAVGLMMLEILNAPKTGIVRESAIALAQAMQMTNFLRDVGEDLRERNRIYLPQVEMAQFGVTERDLAEGHTGPEWQALVKFQIERCRALYAKSDAGIAELPPTARAAVETARILYARILDAIEAQDGDVFRQRARTSRWEKLAVLAGVLVRRRR